MLHHLLVHLPALAALSVGQPHHKARKQQTDYRQNDKFVFTPPAVGLAADAVMHRNLLGGQGKKQSRHHKAQHDQPHDPLTFPFHFSSSFSSVSHSRTSSSTEAVNS